MKLAIVLPDGAADEPVARLRDRTPLEAAHLPNVDWISMNGRQGRARTVPAGFSPGSDVATLSLLGFDPVQYHTGRAPLEAIARGLKLAKDELVFRCNFVTLHQGRMVDFTAGHILQREAGILIAALNETLAGLGCRFHRGVSYRNLMTTRAIDGISLTCSAPHDIPDEPVEENLPIGDGAEWVREVMNTARDLLARHDVNLVRSDLGENPVTDIWLWGQGRLPSLPTFQSRYGRSAAAIAAVDLIRGIALASGMELIDVPGATGYIDTDYVAKGRAAVAALDDFDLVVVHIEAPDEAGHQGDAGAKVEALERIDTDIVGPVLERLRREKQWRILVAPDHPTPVEKRIHTSEPPPFCLAGTAVTTVLNRPFSEQNAAMSDLQIDPGCELMEYFLRP